MHIVPLAYGIIVITEAVDQMAVIEFSLELLHIFFVCIFLGNLPVFTKLKRVVNFLLIQ